MQGLQGPQGLKGDTGATGPQGPQGEQGPQGPSGTILYKHHIIIDDVDGELGCEVTYLLPKATAYTLSELLNLIHIIIGEAYQSNGLSYVYSTQDIHNADDSVNKTISSFNDYVTTL